MMRFVALISLFVLAACNPNGSGVDINTSGIFSPVLFSIDGQDVDGKTVDIGEQLLTDDPKVLTIQVYNDTKFPYTDLDLVITADGDNVPAITFIPTPDGEIKFPGHEGTCQRTLAAGARCTIKTAFAPRDERRYEEKLTLNFKNYVKPETHFANIKAIAGMPASLTFTNDITQYTFGDLVGQSKTPVVERQDQLTYTENLEVVNAGGLPAKNIKITLAQTCTSVLTNDCPAGAEKAYSIESSCPERLEPKETCKVKVVYFPKNFDPDSGPTNPGYKEINYRSTVSYTYVKDPHNSVGTLNGYFRSISTNIEARFRTAITALSFEDPIISGNRDVRSFRVSNMGYREGEIKSLDFRDSGGSFLASCRAQAGSSYLRCQNAGGAALSLEAFPFTIKDRTNCLNTPGEAPFYVLVGNGCVFELTFQPSTNYLVDKTTELQNLQPEVIFDSRWRGNETIVKTNIFLLSAKSKAAARLILDKVSYDSVSYTGAGSSPWSVDLGRLALQSPRFFKRKSMIVTFKNVGSVDATDISIKDASGNVIPIGGTGVNLGTYNPKFYTSALANGTTCAIVAPGESCSITTMFAPIGMDTNDMENANMFDAVDSLGERYKGFRLTYTTGASYTDDNIDADPNYTPQTVETRLKATLIRKGLLMQLADDTRNVSDIGRNVNVAGDSLISRIFIQNIGTGPIPYIRLMNPPKPPSDYNTTLVATTDPASLGAEYDCMNVLDIDMTGTVSPTATPGTRIGNFQGLPKEESCVLSFQMKVNDRYRVKNSTTCTGLIPSTSNLEEGTRLFGRDIESPGNVLWDFCAANTNAINWPNIAFQYYDGDASDPKLPPGSTYGARLSLTNYNYSSVFTSSAKLGIHSFMPWLSSTLYRPSFTYPYVSSSQLSGTVPETWFYGTSQSFFFDLNDPGQTSPFIKGDQSRYFVPTLNAYASRANYDYILYLGAFPQGSGTQAIPLSVRNFGKFRAKITNLYLTPDPAFSYTSAMIPTTPYSLAPAGDITPFSVNFDTTVDGEHWLEVEMTYEDGVHLSPLIYNSSKIPDNLSSAGQRTRTMKFLVVGYVMPTGSYPSLSFSYNDYEVVQNASSPPTETIQPTTNAPMSWNTSPAQWTLLFDTIKLNTTPTANDAYAKKKLIFTNNSSLPISDLKFLYRSDVNGYTTKSLPTSFTVVTAQSNCTSGMTLAAGASCYITMKYQPVSSDVSDKAIMTMIYRAGTGKYLMQNLEISLMPRSPGQLIANGIATETINYKVAANSSSTTRNSYPLNFGTINLDQVPKVLSFDQTTGTYKRVQLVNTQVTKASLLLSYHNYLADNSLRGFSPTNRPPTSTIPQASEYRTVGGWSYVPVHKKKYSNNTDRLVIEASKGCLFGADENDAAVPAHQKGFNKDTNATNFPCFLIITFNPNFEYLLKTISATNGDDMRDTATELWYYSVYRSSTASLWIHVKGTINPDVSIATGSYGNVLSAENKTTSFSVPKFTAFAPGVGDIVGIRVLLASSSATLGNPYAQINTYFDIRPYDPNTTQFTNFTATQGLANGNYYYYRAVAIRKDTRFVDTNPKRWVGLGAGEYLSQANNLATPLKVLVPPIGYQYFHDQKLLIEKTLFGGINYDNYSTSSGRCTGRTRLLLKDPGNLSLPYVLITRNAWNLLLATPAATTYANMTQIPHWLSDPTVTIDSKCSALPGFLPGQSSQKLDASKVFYIRNSSIPSSAVNQAAGGIPGTTDSNYTSYISGAIGFGSARCMINLP